MRRQHLTAVAAVLLCSTCDAPTRPESSGVLMPRVAVARDTLSSRVIQPLSGIEATIVSAGTGAAVASLRLVQTSPPNGPWTAKAAKLQPGTYSIHVRGLVGTQLQHYGVAENQEIKVGKATAPTIVLNPVVSTLNQPPLLNTTAFSQVITYSATPLALDYEVQWARDAGFTTPLSAIASATSVTVTVTDVGTWVVRSRPRLPALAGEVLWSDARQFTVVSSVGGTSPASPIGTQVTAARADTIRERNLTFGTRVGWYRLPSVRAGDSILVETRAARLDPRSPLNTALAVVLADGVTQLAGNDDLSAGTTDSRIVAVAPAPGTLNVVVSAVGNSVGHYELIATIRRLPAAPTSVNAVATSAGSVRLDWIDGADNESSFRIERCATDGCSSYTEIGSAPADALFYVDTGLTAGATYGYRIRARNEVGNSAYAQATAVRLTSPAAPDSLSATTQSGTRIALSWRDRSDNEEAFEVQRCASTACTNYSTLVTLSANSVTYADTSVALDAAYRYRVRARNGVGPSSFAAEVTANTLRPAQPSALLATVQSATRVNLSWTDNADNEQRLIVERCAGTDCVTFTAIDTLLPGTVTVTDSSVTIGQVYKYRVRAENSAGSSAPTFAVLARVLVPEAPQALLTRRESPTNAVLTWTDGSVDETTFDIQRCIGTLCTAFATIASASADAVTYTDGQAPADSSVTYRVRAVNTVGASVFSTALPLSPVPSTIALAPPTFDMTSVGATRTLTPTARFASGGVFSGLAAGDYTWISRGPGVAAVNGTGIVTAVSAGSTRIIAIAPGGARDSVVVVVLATPSWWDASLNFDGGVLPAGWHMREVPTNAGLRNDRLESSVANSDPVAMSDGRAPAGLLGIVIEFDGQVVPSTAIGGQEIELWTGTRRDAVGVHVGSVAVGAGNVKLFAARSGTGGSEQSVVRAVVAGNHRYRVVIRQDSVIWTSKLTSSNAVDAGGALLAPGWDLTALDSIGVRARASEATSWSDNVRVRTITNLATAATVDVNPPVSAVVTGSQVQLTAQVRNVRGALLTSQTPQWASSAPSIATVSSSGVVTGVAAGTARISVAVDGAVAVAVITVVGVSDLLLADDFTATLNAWAERDLDNNGAWSINAGSLYGDYNIGCGSSTCNQLQLLPLDQYQPGTTDWRVEVQAKRDTQYTGFNGGVIGSRATIALWVSDTEKEQITIGKSWQGLSAPTTADSVYAVLQAYPWSGGIEATVAVNQWQTSAPQWAAVERRGNVYRVYWNGQLVLTVTRNFSAPPKVGLQTYGAIRMDNFRLYRLP